ncbi:hypothetical protein SAMN05421878_10343 [Actinobaculum suis]|uniref:Uncharacterized protein n=1 Tax=Actinobaculum suis TaxID=1657 RepID=A0A1G7AR23_9ACTO|nr:hypothetical protein SAMN05421878_10343 [Actinobaculum suis]
MNTGFAGIQVHRTREWKPLLGLKSMDEMPGKSGQAFEKMLDVLME